MKIYFKICLAYVFTLLPVLVLVTAPDSVFRLFGALFFVLFTALFLFMLAMRRYGSKIEYYTPPAQPAFPAIEFGEVVAANENCITYGEVAK